MLSLEMRSTFLNGAFLPYSFGFLIPVLICLVIVKAPQLVNSFKQFLWTLHGPRLRY